MPIPDFMINQNSKVTAPTAVPNPQSPTPAPAAKPAVDPNTKDITSATTEMMSPTAQKQNPLAFSTALLQMSTHFQNNNDLLEQKKLLLKQLYDSPISPDEMKKLSPEAQNAINSGVRGSVETQVRLINDQMTGRKNTLDSAVSFLSGAYDKNFSRNEQLKSDALQTIQHAVTTYGSHAFANYPSDAKRTLEKAAGYPAGTLDRLPPTITETRLDAIYGSGSLPGFGGSTSAIGGSTPSGISGYSIQDLALGKGDSISTNGYLLATGHQVPSLLGGQGRLKGQYNAAADKISLAMTGKPYDAPRAELQYQAAKKWVQTMNSSQMVRYQGLAGSVVNTIDEVGTLANQMKLGGIPAGNKLELESYIQLNGNTPEGQLAAEYLGAVNTLKEEFANLTNGGYAPTDAAWSLANKQINENYGVKELTASLYEVQKLINFRTSAIGSTGPVSEPGQFGKNTGAPTSGSDRVTVTKMDGTQATLPSNQVDAARAAGMIQ